MPVWAQAGIWGSVAGAALLFGVAVGYWLYISQRVVAAIMAFGSGLSLKSP
jgi:ZIP family zinc transporter